MKRKSKLDLSWSFPTFKALTKKQHEYFNYLDQYPIVIATGCGGVGKSRVALHYASTKLYNKEIDEIILTRPTVEISKRGLGFTKGDAEEKYFHFVKPVYSILEDIWGKNLEVLIHNNQIRLEPLEYMIGATFGDNQRTIAILDEAENCDFMQLKLFITRLGKNCTMCINGDLKQSYLNGKAAFQDFISILSKIEDIKQITFTRDDIVRHGLLKEIYEAFGE